MSAPGTRLRDTDSDDALVRSIFEGTASHTGSEFYSVLVKHLALAMDVAGAWVTEFDPVKRRLRALSFWYRDGYIFDFEYAIDGTPCEPVIDKCTLFHVRENVIDLYPRDPELAPLNAVSYLGLPLVGSEGLVIGHLAVLDTKPLDLTPRIEALFRVFGARVGAEIQRVRAEAALREREQELATVLDSTWDAIIVVDSGGVILRANKTCGKMLRRPVEGLIGLNFATLLTPSSAETWKSRMASGSTTNHRFIGELEIETPSGASAAAEATVSPFERNEQHYWTIVLRDLNERREAERQLEALRDELASLTPPGIMNGACRSMRDLFGQINLVAATDATVLITGETGCGKELVARAIHEASSRSSKPMVKVNCAAIPASLMESEFFGHERGAFTGATQRREGRFALADGGTLFLDEVGELPLDLQAKLLRVLQEGEFEPVGSSRTRKVNVRVIAATNRDLRAEAEQNRFRSDLFYRLNVFPISVPALRDRGEDIILLAEAFLQRCGEKMGRRFRPLSSTARALLLGYSWPGNVRELQNVMERAAILSRDGDVVIDSRLLPNTRTAAPDVSIADDRAILSSEQLLNLERTNLIRALEACNWRVAGSSGAAKLLGVPPSTVASRMKALRIERPREK